MNAKDIRSMLGPIARMVKMIKTAKTGERKRRALMRYVTTQIKNRLIKKLKAGIKGGNHSVLNGVLPEKVAVAKGNLQFCRDQMLKCGKEEGEELGESDGVIPGYYETEDGNPIPYKGNGGPTTTAIEDDKHARGEVIAGEKNEKAVQTHPFKAVKRTAVQDYVHHQRKYSFSDHAPGWKFPEDRMPSEHLKSMMAEARFMINSAEKLDKEEDQQGQEKIEEANKASIDAIQSNAKAKELRLKYAEPVSKAALMKQYSDANDELYRCMRDFAAKATKCPKLATKKINTKAPLPHVAPTPPAAKKSSSDGDN